MDSRGGVRLADRGHIIYFATRVTCGLSGPMFAFSFIPIGLLGLPVFTPSEVCNCLVVFLDVKVDEKILPFSPTKNVANWRNKAWPLGGPI